MSETLAPGAKGIPDPPSTLSPSTANLSGGAEEFSMSDSQTPSTKVLLSLPVLPLREHVLFPGVTTPIGAGRPATLRAIEAAMRRPDKLVFAVAQRTKTEEVTAEGLYTIGTVARIGQV